MCAPIDLIVPKEGLGWELEVTAIVKGTKNLEAAKKLADWAASKKANELYAKTYPIVAYPGVANTPPNYPPNLEKVMVKNDVEWMAKNRDAVLAYDRVEFVTDDMGVPVTRWDGKTFKTHPVTGEPDKATLDKLGVPVAGAALLRGAYASRRSGRSRAASGAAGGRVN